MLPRVVRQLGEVVDPVVVVAAPGQDVPALPESIAIVRDETEGRGPLQGLAAGLNALRGQVDAIYLSSCDAPFLRPAFVRRLIDLMGDAMICVPRVGDYDVTIGRGPDNLVSVDKNFTLEVSLILLRQ